MKNKITHIEKIVSILPMLFVVGFNIFSDKNIPSYLIALSDETNSRVLFIISILSTYNYWFIFSVISIIGVFEIIYREKRYGWGLIISSWVIDFIFLLPLIGYIVLERV